MELVRSAFLVVVTGLCLVTANPAAAAIATASLDWSNFQIFALGIPGGPPPSYSFSQQNTSWSTNASTVNDSSDSRTHTAFNWISALDISSETPNATAEARASTETFSTRTSASDSFSSNPSSVNQANASVSRTATLLLSGPMAVIFSVPYSMSVDGVPFDFSRHATANVTGSASFTPNQGGGFAQTSRSFGLESLFSGPASLSGNLFFGLVVDGDGVLNVSLSTVTSATAPDPVPVPVPEPSVTLTLLAGLVVIGMMFKRRLTARGMGDIPAMV